MTNNLFLFTNDLRLDDNWALQAAAAQSQRLALAYLFDDNECVADFSDCRFTGNMRLNFIRQALRQLQTQLKKFDQHLHIVSSHGVSALIEFIERHQITTLFCSTPAASNEKRKLAFIVKRCGVTLHCVNQTTLQAATDLPFSIAELPQTFSAFRRKVEKQDLNIQACIKLISLPPPVAPKGDDGMRTAKTISSVEYATNGAAILNDYFKTKRALTYKQTRNALDDEAASTRFSPLLANGLVSARQIWWALKAFEQNHQATESTYWIGFELLWRDYFYWLLAKHKDRFFKFTGITGKRPLTSFHPQRFKAFCSGRTPSALVNAAVNQLNATGYLSNRARQIVASYFVNELQLDWRFGAKFFQMQLIDYDVAANWGNWQYIAGVGCDPRQGRHFNIDKQQQLYDPDGHYIKRWRGQSYRQTLDSDMVDWPQMQVR
ncbi:DASH family cryptochrome [Thalassotalea sp. Y01]|uniref:DASH family cryptochrome n=1 Tax=Thalassotalea sp. Y01 TaxID=2729613 RepID=UPI00145D6114|nr:DASH family cryptochrome [Thalassotalea sp. Y01]NMP15759.1 DASH family cryptochrome [Thalassotalea sp. Y01]